MANTPSLTGLRAFEALMRTRTLTAAARELCVTPAAISHRIKDLNAASSAPLMVRENGVFKPTAHGQRILDTLGDAFLRIREAHAALPLPTVRPVEVVVSYSFAVMWLLPKLAEFQNRFPGVLISINPSHTPIADARSSTSVTIVHSADRPEGAGWQKLFDDVCAIVGAAGHSIMRPTADWTRDIAQYPLVHISHERGARQGEFSWSEWAGRCGCSGMSFPVDLHVTAEHVALDIVMTNRSLALISLINADRFIRAGRAEHLPASKTLSGKSYWIRANETADGTGSVAAKFLQWLHVNLAQTRAHYV